MQPDSGLQLSHIHTRQWYSLRQVPVLLASLCYVEQGSKLVSIAQKSESITQNQLLLLPARHEFEIVNRPDQGAYRASMLSFSADYLIGFKQRYQGLLATEAEASLRLALPVTATLLRHWREVHSALTEHASLARQVHAADGLLLCLQEAQALDYWLSSPLQDWPEKLEQLFMLQAWRDWTLESVAQHFHIGASTLRRHLQKHQQSFSQILERVRMAIALQRLQTSNLAIADIASQVGYHSASRFSQRFRQRYGVPPSQVGRQPGISL